MRKNLSTNIKRNVDGAILLIMNSLWFRLATNVFRCSVHSCDSSIFTPSSLVCSVRLIDDSPTVISVSGTSLFFSLSNRNSVFDFILPTSISDGYSNCPLPKILDIRCSMHRPQSITSNIIISTWKRCNCIGLWINMHYYILIVFERQVHCYRKGISQFCMKQLQCCWSFL